MVLRKKPDIIHLAVGGSEKFLHLLRGDPKSFGSLQRGGQKSLMTKIFNCPAHPTKVFMNTPLMIIKKKNKQTKTGCRHPPPLIITGYRMPLNNRGRVVSISHPVTSHARPNVVSHPVTARARLNQFHIPCIVRIFIPMIKCWYV